MKKGVPNITIILSAVLIVLLYNIKGMVQPRASVSRRILRNVEELAKQKARICSYPFMATRTRTLAFRIRKPTITTKMLVVPIETGYLMNPQEEQEEKVMLMEGVQFQMASSILKGIKGVLKLN